MEVVSSKFLYKFNMAHFKGPNSNSVHFANTRIVAYYERQWKNITPAARIRYFIEPLMELYPLDLNAGYKEYRMTSMYSKDVDLCLNYAMSAEDCKIKNRTKVYTRYTTLVHLMDAICSKKIDELSIRVTRYDGNIYMTTGDPNEAETTEPGDKTVNSPVEVHHNQLKRYVFADSSNARPNVTEPWNENIELLAVFRSNLNKYDIIYSGPIQAIIAKEQFNDLYEKEQILFIQP